MYMHRKVQCGYIRVRQSRHVVGAPLILILCHALRFTHGSLCGPVSNVSREVLTVGLGLPHRYKNNCKNIHIQSVQLAAPAIL